MPRRQATDSIYLVNMRATSNNTWHEMNVNRPAILPDVSVFTPTMNRHNTIERVFNSLCEQSFKNFEWIIIDDGNDLETTRLVEKWMKTAFFPIRYIRRKVNRGKHIAWNEAIVLAKGELIVPADSDDAFAPTSLEDFWQCWTTTKSETLGDLAGVVCLCQDQNGNPVGEEFPANKQLATFQEMVFKYKCGGERWLAISRSAALETPFPEVYGIRFLPEGFVWYAPLGAGRRFVHINKRNRVYYRNESNTDSLMQMSDIREKSMSLAYWNVELLNKELHWFNRAPVFFFSTAVRYVRFGLNSGQTIHQLFRLLEKRSARLLLLISAPIGYALHKRDIIMSNLQKDANTKPLRT